MNEKTGKGKRTMIQERKAENRQLVEGQGFETKKSVLEEDPLDGEWKALRILKGVDETRMDAGASLPKHVHKDAEMLSFILEGQLEHEDNFRHLSMLNAGDVQKISAGSGIEHIERNPSFSAPVRFIQISFKPDKPGLKPGYEWKTFSKDEKKGRMLLIASGDRADGSLFLRCDANVYESMLDKGEEAFYSLGPGRSAWLQVLKGSLMANGIRLDAGSGAAIFDEETLSFEGRQDCEFLFVDLG